MKMKLYASIGPNPDVVRMFMREKGIELPEITIDLMAGENRKPPYTDKNPMGQLPCLELDNGEYLAEITAICEYLEEKHPNPPLIGETPEERARTRMWTRRIDLNICEPMVAGFRYSEGLKLFESRMIVIPEAAKGLKEIARSKLEWLNGQMQDRQWIAGDRITLADIMLFCFLQFGTQVRQPLPEGQTALHKWFDRMSSRESAAT